MTRQPAELEAFLAIADQVGLRHLVTASDHTDPTGGDGLLVARIKAAVAAEEVAKLKKRLELKRDELADAGKYGGGRYPFGRGPAMAIREDEAAIIREAARRVLAGESLRSVAIDLSDRGLGQRSGGRWPGGATWGQRITAPHVAGLRVHRGKIVSEATWEPILDRETWDRLVALRADPSRRTQSGAPARHAAQRRYREVRQVRTQPALAHITDRHATVRLRARRRRLWRHRAGRRADRGIRRRGGAQAAGALGPRVARTGRNRSRCARRGAEHGRCEARRTRYSVGGRHVVAERVGCGESGTHATTQRVQARRRSPQVAGLTDQCSSAPGRSLICSSSAASSKY